MALERFLGYRLQRLNVRKVDTGMAELIQQTGQTLEGFRLLEDPAVHLPPMHIHGHGQLHLFLQRSPVPFSIQEALGGGFVWMSHIDFGQTTVVLHLKSQEVKMFEY